MDNVGSSAWEVSSADEEYVETSGGENPTITLETGVRYTISNEGWSIHPLAFRDESGSILLSQRSEGEFENDGDVNWSDSGSTLSFTLTDELANEISSYICTIHGSMQGIVATDDRIDFADEAFSEEQYNAVFPENESQTELSSAINEWFNSPTNEVNGVEIEQTSLSELINFWFQS
jgi:hypothetical protein